MRIYKAKDYNEMSRKAANIISAQIIMKPDAVLGLATGSSPIGTYKQLIDWYNKGDLDFSEIRSVNLDEYKGLDASNPQSYAYFMRHNLFDSVNIKPENTNIPNGLETDIDEVPTHAYSTGIKNIMQARSILLIASGEAKAEAMYQALFGPITPTVPASILQLHNNVSIVADEAALSLIIKNKLI